MGTGSALLTCYNKTPPCWTVNSAVPMFLLIKTRHSFDVTCPDVISYLPRHRAFRLPLRVNFNGLNRKCFQPVAPSLVLFYPPTLLHCVCIISLLRIHYFKL